MLVRFADSVPESERRWIAALVRRCGRLWGFADWEVRVECGDLKRNVVATVAVHPGGSQACVTMDQSRMYDRAVLRTDLIHELWHVPMWGIFAALQDLAAHIPPKRRRPGLEAATRRYEVAHDYTARIWAPLLRERRAKVATKVGGRCG